MLWRRAGGGGGVGKGSRDLEQKWLVSLKGWKQRGDRSKLTPGGILCYDEESREGGEARRGEGDEGKSVVAALRRASMAGERGGLTIKRSVFIILGGLCLDRQSPGGVSIPVLRFSHLRSPSASPNFVSFPRVWFQISKHQAAPRFTLMLLPTTYTPLHPPPQPDTPTAPGLRAPTA